MLSRMMTIAAGIAVTTLLPALPPVFTLCAALAMASIALWFSRSMLMPLLFLLGVAWGIFFGYGVVAGQLPADFEGEELWVEGEVIGLPELLTIRSQSSTRFLLQLTAPICKPDNSEDCYSGVRQIKLNWYQPVDVIPGQIWRLLVKVKRPHGMANPGGFDYQSWLIQRGVGAVGYVRQHASNQRLKHRAISVDRIRWGLAQNIDQYTAEHKLSLKNTAIFKALLLGDKREITRAQWDLFSATGTTHLMVISGLHIGLVSSVVYFLIRYLVVVFCARCAAERWAAVVSIVVAIGYALAAGLSLPTQRALVMVTVVMIVILCRRSISLLSGFVVALLACLLLDPLAPVSASFWLSFIAVAAILYGTSGRRFSSSFNGQWFSVQYVVFIGLLPVLAIFLGKMSVLSPLANGVLVPVFSLLVIPLNLLAGLLSFVDIEAAGWIWHVLDWTVSRAFEYLEILTRYGTQAIVAVGAVSWAAKGLALLAVLILLAPRGLPLRWMGLVLLLPIVWPSAPSLEEGDVSLSVLDVGQGLSIVVQTQNHALVYDVGPAFSPSFDTATAAVLPFLRHHSIKQIDTLVISHADNDHAGAWHRLLEHLPVDQLIVGEPLSDHKTPSDLSPTLSPPLSPPEQACHDERQWAWDGVHFAFLHPVPAVVADGSSQKYSSNNRSCVLMITAGKHRFLLTGDIERSVEADLIRKRGHSLSADVLIAPHHGSNTSSTLGFIQAVDPDYVIFSSGYLNRFRHPAKKVRARYSRQGVHQLTTSESGAITFKVRDNQLSEPIEYRLRNRRYWL